MSAVCQGGRTRAKCASASSAPISSVPLPHSISADQTSVDIVPVTAVEDGMDHAVSLDAMAIGIQTGEGHYTTACSKVIEPAALTTPPGRPCPACWAVLRDLCHRRRTSTSRMPTRHRHRHRADGMVRRWVSAFAAHGRWCRDLT